MGKSDSIVDDDSRTLKSPATFFCVHQILVLDDRLPSSEVWDWTLEMMSIFNQDWYIRFFRE